MSSVTLQQVSRRFGASVALHPTDLVVTEGEFLTLLGPSGCGKTTTLRIVAGFVPPSSGRVLFGDDDVTDLPPNRRQIGMVFQDYALFPHLTVAQNIGFALQERRMPRGAIAARVGELLELIHLPGLGARYPAQLSGGQQQRVALARALAHPPRVLLMDEPLSALDLKLREAMQDELRRIQQRLGMTTIFVTHDQAEAMSMSDSIAVMSEGRVVQRGTAQLLFERPVNRFVASFLGQLNTLEPGSAEAGRLGWPAGKALGVRPHQVRFAAEGLAVTVLGTAYAGTVNRTRVQLSSGEWVVESPAGLAIPAPGSAAWVAWLPQHALILDDGGGDGRDGAA